jgi:peptide/nickel transport system ATP-binding protein
VDLPPDVRRHVDEAFDALDSGGDREAQEYLLDQFGSECDLERPAHHPVGEDERVSLCHRHTDDHEEPGTVYDQVIAATSDDD